MVEIENDGYPAVKLGQFPGDDTLSSQNFYNPCPAELYLSMNLRQIQQYIFFPSLIRPYSKDRYFG